MLPLCSRTLRQSWAAHSQKACYATGRRPGKAPPGYVPNDKWNYNKSSLYDPAPVDASGFSFVDANELEKETKPPRGVKMLARDYIENSLYNPHYGYFSKQATIFDSRAEPIDFSKLRDSAEFSSEVNRRYSQYGDDAQLWHTPTELFRPWYAQSVARCLVSEYLLKYFPYEDFNIYEIGAGNGTLARDILDFLQAEYPAVYERTRYTIIEISENLAGRQRQLLQPAHPCVNVVNKSIFRWRTKEPSPCFFVAMEVVDNFAHDVVRYDMQTLEPYQGVVSIDNDGDYDMHYSRVSDPLIASFLRMRAKLGHPLPMPAPLQSSPRLRNLYSRLPLAPNMSREEYIPTRLLSLLQTLRKYFPRHRLLLSDFSELPDTIPGENAPVVQTRFGGRTVPTSQLLVQAGLFDIFFPTNFERLRDMYELALSQPAGSWNSSRHNPLINTSTSVSLSESFFSPHVNAIRRKPRDGVASASGLPVGERKSNVFTHAEFLNTYADLEHTTLKNGENPMVQFYQNVKFLF